MSDYGAWTTQNELRFIALLGTHSLHDPNCAHQEWVKRYQATLDLRKDWGEMDQNAVRAAVKKELA